MRNRGQLRTTIKSRLNVDAGDINFFTDTVLDDATKTSLEVIGTLHDWSQTEDVETQTIASDDNGTTYINTPEDFKAESVFKIYVNDIPYTKYNYQKYLTYKDQSATGDYFAEYGGQLHISNALSTGDVVDIHGHKLPKWVNSTTYEDVPSGSEDDADLHPFRNEPRLEEAIIKHSLGLAYKKQEGSYTEKGIQEIQDAINLAQLVWDQRTPAISTGRAQSSRWN